MPPKYIKQGQETQYDPSWTYHPVAQRTPNLNQSSANLSHANETWANMTKEQKVKQAQADTDAAKVKSDQANSAAGIAGETIKQTGKTLIGGAIKFARSAVSAVADPITNLFKGKGAFDEVTPGTYQADIQKTTEEVFDNAAQGHADSNWDLEKKALGATADVVMGGADVLGGAEGLEAVGKFGAKTVGKFLTDKTVSAVEKSASKEALGVVTPTLTKKETEAALASGRGQGGGFFSKTKIAPDKRLLEVADATKGIVRKGASGAENIKSVRKALSTEADSLSTNVEKIKQPVSVKGATSWLKDVPKPIEIEADATQSRKFDITKNALTKILQKNLGENPTVSSLLKSRKEFDALVDKEFPTLYEKENAAFRPAVKAMRDGINDAIEANLPDGFGYKESLKKQSLFYDAIDNIAGKSSQEVGTSKIGRVIDTVKKHPVASAAIGYGAYKAEQEVKNLTGL